MGVTEEPGPRAGVLLSDEEAMQIIAVLAEVLDGHDVHDAVSAASSLLSNRLAAQARVADPSPEYLAGLRRRLADRPAPGLTADTRRCCRQLTGSLLVGEGSRPRLARPGRGVAAC